MLCGHCYIKANLVAYSRLVCIVSISVTQHKAARAAAEEAAAQEQLEPAEVPEAPEEAPAAEDSADEASESSTMEICYN